MGAKVLIIGVGDVGGRFARLLGGSGEVDRLVLAGLCQGEGPFIAGMMSSCYDLLAEFVELDATRQADVETLIREAKPDLIVQSGALISPFTLFTRTDPVARAIVAAGLGLQLSAQIPVLKTVMQAVREVGYEGPVANISFPDVTNPLLHKLDLMPTVGLGNANIMVARARDGLRRRMIAAGEDPAELPLVRVIGHHHQVYGPLLAQIPEDADERIRVYLGEEGRRDDEVAYAGFPLRGDWTANELTTCAALPVLRALLPGAAPLRTSCPAPEGLPGGYPVRIADGAVTLDLPPGVDLDAAVAFQTRIMAQDGIEAIADDGTVSYTGAARQAMGDIDPELAEPLHPDQAAERFRRLAAALAR